MQSVHLIVLIHGLYGTPINLAVVKAELDNAGQDAEVPIASFVTTSFTGSHTWDGVDVNAYRTVQEVRDHAATPGLMCRLIGKWRD